MRTIEPAVTLRVPFRGEGGKQMSIEQLDRDHPMPLWAQLEAELRRRLQTGEFADGAFPTDLELTKTYEVSRHTVREAVRQLNTSGVLTRERGRGTVVNRTEFEQSLGTLYSLYQSIEATGVEQTSDVIDIGVRTNPDAAERLQLAAGDELLYLARLRRAGGEPIAVDRTWMPAATTRPLLDVDWTRTALYTELAAIGASVPTHGWERLTPVVPAADDRASLELPAGVAAFFLERVGMVDQVPIEWRTTVIRGDRYRFVADWSAAGASSLRPTTA